MPTDNPLAKETINDIKAKISPVLIIESRRVFGNKSYTDENILKFWHNIDVSKIQNFESKRLFKLFGANDSSFSASLVTHIRMLSDNLHSSVKKPNGSDFKEGQAYLNSFIESMEVGNNYSNGFSQPNTLNDQITRLARNILTSDNAAGALFVELNPDTYEAVKFNILDCDAIKFKEVEGKYIPCITGYINTSFTSKGNITYKELELDVANFLWQPFDSDAAEINGNNPLRPGLRTTFTKMEFFDNLRKVLRNQAWPKIKVVISLESVMLSAPVEIQKDKKKLIEYTKDYLGTIESQLTGISADENIIVYDTIKEVSFLETEKNFDPRPIQSLLNSDIISGYKAPPSAVGQGGSTRTGEGLASAELVIFRRSIKALRKLIEDLYSRAFTLALRLSGRNGYVKSYYDEFSLRPPEEAAQFISIEQNSIIEAWLTGSISTVEKNEKIRKLHGLTGAVIEDGIERTDSRSNRSENNKEVYRGPISEENKEKTREETRKNNKVGNERKQV